EDDPAHAPLVERVDRAGHAEIRLSRARRPDADDDVVLRDGRDVSALALRLGHDDAPRSGERDADLALRVHDAARAERVRALREARDVVRVERRPQPGQLDDVLHDRHGALDRRELTREDDVVAAQHDADAEEAPELLDVAIVHAGEHERIGALCIQPVLDRRLAIRQSASREPQLPRPRFAVTSNPRASSSLRPTGAGAPSKSARAAVVLGNAITSRRLPDPVNRCTIRSMPSAMPPWGGAPAASAPRRNPNLVSISSSESPRT